MKKNAPRLLETLGRYSNTVTLIKGSPDPDAIASAFAFRAICECRGVKNTICAEKKISLPQNRAMVDRLGIPLKFDFPADPGRYDAYLVFDHQSARIPESLRPLPCLAHIDHHEEVKESVACDFSLIMPEAGSTSTIMALLLREMDIEISAHDMTRICTALLYGIETDTDTYSHAGRLDYEAIDFISHHSDSSMAKRLSSVPLSKKTVSLLWKAMENLHLYKDWLMAGLGFIDEGNRDSIAIVADFLVKREDAAVVIVFAAIEKHDGKGLTLDASFRSKEGKTNLDGIIKEITSQGGARKYKGAFQIDMNYFRDCPDRDLLWKTISVTTIDILQRRRDELYLTDIKSYYSRIKGRLYDFLNR
jgi:nanoRNase/pAp phosphatase (c-di-AMP/oligoRNAs hydrolase)